jgi:hypothetical protein
LPIERAGRQPYGYVPPRTHFACLSAPFFLLIWPTARAGPLRSCAAPRPTSSAAVVSCGPCVARARAYPHDFVLPNRAKPRSLHPTVPLRALRGFFPAATRSMSETDLPWSTFPTRNLTHNCEK